MTSSISDEPYYAQSDQAELERIKSMQPGVDDMTDDLNRLHEDLGINR